MEHSKTIDCGGENNVDNFFFTKNLLNKIKLLYLHKNTHTMNPHRTHKKNLIVSYKSLSADLLELLKEKYPDGYVDYIQRFEKPNGETIFVVPLETADTVYMIKFDVKIDTTYTDDDTEKDYFDEEVAKADSQFAPLQEVLDKEDETQSHTERVVRHGNYDDTLDDAKRRITQPHSLSALGEELQEAFSDDMSSEDYDDYSPDNDEDTDDDSEEEYEPTDEELMDIDSELYANAEIPPEELERMAKEEADKAAKPKRPGRPRKNAAAPAAEPAAPKKKGRPRIKKD